MPALRRRHERFSLCVRVCVYFALHHARSGNNVEAQLFPTRSDTTTTRWSSGNVVLRRNATPPLTGRSYYPLKSQPDRAAKQLAQKPRCAVGT